MWNHESTEAIWVAIYAFEKDPEGVDTSYMQQANEKTLRS